MAKKIMKKKVRKAESTVKESPKESPKAAPQGLDYEKRKQAAPAKAPAQEKKKQKEPDSSDASEDAKPEPKKAMKEKKEFVPDPVVVKQATIDVQKEIKKQENKGHGCPQDWHTKYKKDIGSYKKFVLNRPELFAVTNVGANFIVTPAGKKPNQETLDNLSTPGKRKDWKKALKAAWFACSGGGGNSSEFLATAQEVVKSKPPESTEATPASPKTSPKTSPKVSPNASPNSSLKVKKKLKKKVPK